MSYRIELTSPTRQQGNEATLAGAPGLALGNHRRHWLPVAAAIGAAVAVAPLGAGRQAEGLIDRRQEVGRGYRAVLDIGRLSVAGAVDLSATDASAGEQRRLAGA